MHSQFRFGISADLRVVLLLSCPLHFCTLHAARCTRAHCRYAYSQVAEATVGTPFFAPRNAPREVPKGRLFGMQIHRGDLKALEVIGAGQFGAVYLATQNMRRCPGCGKDYAIDGHLKRCLEKCTPSIAYDASKIVKHDVTRAVKMLKGVANAAAKKEFFDEANVMLMFDHPNVTNIMGVAVQQAPWLYVLEYCMYGDVRGVLKGCLQKRIVLHAGEMIHMCLGTSRGMEHLAELRLVHMDLAARNVRVVTCCDVCAPIAYPFQTAAPASYFYLYIPS